jgi:Amt family ammonium transporter
MKRKVSILLLLTLLVLLIAALPALAGDPSGAATGGKADYDFLYAGKSLKDAIGHNAVSANFIWVLLTGFLILFFQTGFALVETGFCRAKNAVHTIMMNFVVFAVGAIGWYIMGFALAFGGVGGFPTLGGGTMLNGLLQVAKDWGILGYKGFFLSTGGTYDVVVYTMFFFQLVFMDTACTIPTGAMAERWKFSAFVIYGFFMSMLIYPVFANWVWGAGWLAALGRNLGLGHGYIDFAGSSVVHAMGGFVGLAGAIVLGARIGKFNKDGSPNAIVGHDIPLAILGTFILLFGWFGFNGGSTLAATDLRIAVVVVNTLLAACAGALGAMFTMWIKFGKPDASMTANGLLAGLVAITAPAAFVEGWAALLIGAVGGVLVVASVLFVERVLKVDDPVGAISVHGTNGIWGVISVGIFADGAYGVGWNGVGATAAKGVTGLLYGDASQLVAQLIGAVVVVVWAFGMGYILFKVMDLIMGIRVSPETEIEGLDLPEMGSHGYPEFQVRGQVEPVMLSAKPALGEVDS